jgi:hypothetical protein
MTFGTGEDPFCKWRGKSKEPGNVINLGVTGFKGNMKTREGCEQDKKASYKTHGLISVLKRKEMSHEEKMKNNTIKLKMSSGLAQLYSKCGFSVKPNLLFFFIGF